VTLVEDEHEGSVGIIDQPTEPGGEGVAQLDGHCSRDVPRGEDGDGTGVHELGPVGHEPAHLVRAECRQRRWFRAVDGRAAIDLAQTPEVRRIGTEAGEQRLAEGIVARGDEQQIGRLLAADGRRPFPSGGSGAERPRPVCRVDDQVVGKAQDALVEGPPQGAGQ